MARVVPQDSPCPPVIPACVSGLLLAFSFPLFHFGFLGWIALAPLLFSVESAKSRADALIRGFAAGAVFFLISLHWIIHVAFIAWPLLVLLESVFVMLFAWAVYEGRGLRNPILKILWIGFAWMTLEIFRSEVPVFGFGWNLLAFSQSGYPAILQSANLFGAYGLGFVMACINACIFEAMRTVKKMSLPHRGYPDPVGKILSMGLRGVPPRRDDEAISKPEIATPAENSGRLAMTVLLGILIFTALFAYGRHELSRPQTAKGSLRISVIQGNIPQSVKWEAVAREKILEIYLTLTQLASFDQPGLIIWPEAAFPGYFNRDIESPQLQELAHKTGIPLLFGAPHLVTDEIAYNSAYLMDAEGNIRDRYDKQNLVPFGEYVPLKFLFGFLQPVADALGVSDFSAGKTPTVFRLFNNEIIFSVLICFEDSFSYLARHFVDRGAQFLVVMTNDAWFGRSAAPYQHLDASLFRAVENGVPVIRAANTGVSAFISPKGEVVARVRNKKGEDIFTTGKETAEVRLGSGVTLFRRGGWIFPYAGAALFAIIFPFVAMRKKRE